MAKMTKIERPDAVDPKLLKQIERAISQVFGWCHMRRKCVTRCSIGADFYRCEKCKAKVPRIQVDHIIPRGDLFSPGYLERTFCPSTELQGLCKKCHRPKTRRDNKRTRATKKKRLELRQNTENFSLTDEEELT